MAEETMDIRQVTSEGDEDSLEAQMRAEYLAQIRYLCLVMSPRYLRENFAAVLAHANDAEQRLEDPGCTMDALLADNALYRARCEANGLPFHLIDGVYAVGPDLFCLEKE